MEFGSNKKSFKELRAEPVEADQSEQSGLYVVEEGGGHSWFFNFLQEAEKVQLQGASPDLKVLRSRQNLRERFCWTVPM